MKKTELPGGATFYEGPKGSVLCQSGAPGVVEAKYWGEHDVQSFLIVSAEVERRGSNAPKMRLYSDLSNLTNYDGEFRALWVKWFTAHRPRVERKVFYQKSVLVKLGISMVNIALGGIIESYTSEAEYERAKAVAGLKPIIKPAQAA